MQKFLKNILKFSLFCFAGYIVFVCLFGTMLPSYYSPNIQHVIGKYGHLHSRISELNKKESIDILILGSSHAYRGIDTRIIDKTGRTSFNLGSSSQTPKQSEILLKRYINKVNPELIILEVYPGTYTSDGVESSLDLLSNSPMDYNLVKLALSQKNPKIFNTVIYSGFRQLFDLDKDFEENPIKTEDTYIPGGFVERDVEYFKKDTYKENTWDFKNDQFEAFYRCIELIKKEEVECLLVYSPISSNGYNSYLNQPYFDSIMSSRSTYIDFNKSINLDDSLHFYDSHHLNQDGVEIYNNQLVLALDSLGFTR